VLLSKQLHRFYKRLETNKIGRLLEKVSEWAAGIEEPAIRDKLGIIKGQAYADDYPTVPSIYRDYVEYVEVTLARSARLEGSGLMQIWIELLELGLGAKKVMPLELPRGHDWLDFRNLLKDALILVKEHATLVWSWPSWLVLRGRNHT
jgi:hypothetical protein